MVEESKKAWGDYIHSEIKEWMGESGLSFKPNEAFPDEATKKKVAAWVHRKFNLPGTAEALEAKSNLNEVVDETMELLNVIPKPNPYLLYMYELYKEEEAKKIAEGKDPLHPVVL